MKKWLLIAVIMAAATAVQPAWAHTPKGGLGDAAISPDGKTLVVGGDTRVLYVLDPQTYEVKDRVYFKSNIFEMEFNKDGSTLIIEDVKSTLYFLETGTWKVKAQFPNSGSFSAASQVDLVACLNSGSKKSVIEFRSMTDGASKGKIEYPGSVTIIGLSAKGDRLVTLAAGEKGQEEKKPVPSDVSGFDRDVFSQKNDGEVSVMTEYEVPSGKQIRQQVVFYKPSIPKAILVGEKESLVVAYNGLHAKWSGEEITLFKVGNSYSYGAEVSLDRKVFVSGGLAAGDYVKAEDQSAVAFRNPPLPGWPEYFEGFGFAPDGTAYGVTTAYRLVVIDNQGQITKVVPIY